MSMGYIHVYTGEGKGKTTCALGLALRAAGDGKRVYIGQFLKDGEYSEIKAIKEYLPMVTVEQFGSGKGFVGKEGGTDDDIACARNGYQKALEALTSRRYDVVILDEINIAVHMGLLSEQSVIALMNAKPEETELVLTGRYAAKGIIERADLVTEMLPVKHYFQKGVAARTGIEK